MLNFLKRHLHPLGGRIIFWNLVLLLLVKVIFPNPAFPLASLVNSIPVFDSREIIKDTNNVRAQYKLPPLRANVKLDLAASEKLDDMAIKEYFAHVSPGGIDPWYWFKQAQYKYSFAGENLAIGFTTADATVEAWVNSPSHKANLLNPQYQEIGVAVRGVNIEGRQGLLVVQLFGRPLSQDVVLATTANVATPSSTPKISVASTPGTVKASETKIILQPISTDKAIKPVESPIRIETKSDIEPRMIKVSKLLNNVYSIYAMAIALISAFSFFFYERNKFSALKTSFNLAIFFLSVLIPLSVVVSTGWIF